MVAPVPTDERGRLRALHDLDILDTPPEPDFDDIARLAAMICGTPMSLVSLVDNDRQWFKARVGFDVEATPRDESFCAHAILGRGLMVVADARADIRFADNPYVRREPGVRFYAGAPLVTSDGHALGALCVVDAVPRRLTVVQLRALRALARQVTGQLELRHHAATAARETTRRHQLDRLSDELVPLLGGRLREPLQHLRSCAEVLRDHDSCPPELAERIGAMAHAHAPDLLRLLDELLSIAGPTGGEPVVRRRTVDLNALADWAVREVRPIAEAKDIMLRVDAAETAAPVLADPRRLAQALAHVLFNAVKFTPVGGRVLVRVRSDGGPGVEVHDVGAGDEPARLYEHVYGAIKRPPAEEDGMALGPDAGLAVVKTIFDAHHASVALSEGQADGTALHVVFPPAA